MDSVEIITPSRLHFALLDMHGGLGRVDGGIGVALDKPSFHAIISEYHSWQYPRYMKSIVEKAVTALKLKKKYKIEVLGRIPPHVGLGSRTQASLALAYGASLIEGKVTNTLKLAEAMGRGGTSGIGTYAFIRGGLIVDGGHSMRIKHDFLPSHFSRVPPPPIVTRVRFPKKWAFLLTIPPFRKTYGKNEKKIFGDVCPINKRDVEIACRIVLMKILPGVIEKDINDVGEGLTMLQKVGFKKVENSLLGEKNAELQNFLLKRGAYGVGLSSFGPTVYSLFESDDDARNVAMEVKDRFGYKCMATKARNKGAEKRINHDSSHFK